MKDRFEEAEKEANERARQESEEFKRQRALARGPPPLKRKPASKHNAHKSFIILKIRKNLN